MFDYYAHVLEMNEEKLVLEIEKLTKRIVATNPTSPIFNQLKKTKTSWVIVYYFKIIKFKLNMIMFFRKYW